MQSVRVSHLVISSKAIEPTPFVVYNSDTRFVDGIENILASPIVRSLLSDSEASDPQGASVASSSSSNISARDLVTASMALLQEDGRR